LCGNFVHIRNTIGSFQVRHRADRRSEGAALISAFGVLHCDKASWFGHIEAPTLRFVVQGLIVSDDNGLGVCRQQLMK
jgi:hypothetical protein